jgi:hypothetical protein
MFIEPSNVNCRVAQKNVRYNLNITGDQVLNQTVKIGLTR